MGIINTIKGLLKKKQEVRTLPQQQIDDYITDERTKLKLEAIKNYERQNFLYNWSDQNG